MTKYIDYAEYYDFDYDSCCLLAYIIHEFSPCQLAD
jgi:hypothetical protein